MIVWIINPYGNIPGEGWRTYRTTLIANAFTANGHQVVSWVSNIQHRSKEKRAETWADVQVDPNYLIRIVPSTPYQQHISLARIKYERTYAKQLAWRVEQGVGNEEQGVRSKEQGLRSKEEEQGVRSKEQGIRSKEQGVRNEEQGVRSKEQGAGSKEQRVWSEEDPDLIILGEPALFISNIILDIVKAKKCALIVDVIDLWPELFNILLPKKLAAYDKFLFAPLYRRRNKLLRQADGIMAVAKDYLEIALKANPKVPNAVVYWGLDVQEVKSVAHREFESSVLQKLTKQDHEIWVVYAGTLGPNYDIKTIVECAKGVAKVTPNIKFIIAGDGPLRDLVTQPLSNLVYVGSLTSKDVSLLYQKCDIALSSYVSGSTVSMPIKAYDYLAAGLPLINSLGRDLGDFVVERKVGLQYIPENVTSMMEAVLSMAYEEEFRKQMSSNALALADEFDARSEYIKVVRLAEKVMANHSN